jgi:hypothetical protein
MSSIEQSSTSTPLEPESAEFGMSLALADLEEFCTYFNPDSAGADLIAWNILSAGLCKTSATQPAKAQEVIGRLAASKVIYSRVLAAFAIGFLTTALPPDERAPAMEMWATLLSDECNEVQQEAAQCLLSMTEDRQLSEAVFRDIFAKAHSLPPHPIILGSR